MQYTFSDTKELAEYLLSKAVDAENQALRAKTKIDKASFNNEAYGLRCAADIVSYVVFDAVSK